MRKTILLTITLLTLTSCRKESRLCCMPPIEPLPATLITQDTITQGNFWDFNIGDPAASIYQKIQQIGPLPNVVYMAVAANTYSRLEDVATKLSLYRELTLKDMNRSEIVTLSFGNNKVSGIYIDFKGKKKVWPSMFDRNSIRIGDAIETVYNNLLAIRSREKYTRFFGNIILGPKDIDKEYEAGMAASSRWQLYATDAGNRSWYVDLQFSSGILTTIVYTHLQNP